MLHKTFYLTLLSTSALLLPIMWSCSRTDTSATNLPTVAVSTPEIADVVEAIADEGFDVVTIAGGTVDAESFEPSPLTMQKLSKASLFIATGTLPFENDIARQLSAGTVVLRMNSFVSTIKGTHGDELEEDPHMWVSLRNLSALADTIPTLLSAERPDSMDTYRQRATVLRNELAQLDNRIDSSLNAAGRPAFGVWHPSLSYFARDYALTQIAVGAEHREFTPNSLRLAVTRLKNNNAKVLFYDNPGLASAAQTVAEAAGVEAVQLPAPGKPYHKTIEAISDILAAHGTSSGH